MAGGELAAALGGLAQDTAQALEDAGGKVAGLLEDSADIEEANLARIEDAEAKSTQAAEAAVRQAGREPGAAGPVVDSRGRVVPPGVERLPSGRLPANFEYAGKVYDGPRWTAKLAEKYPNGVAFTKDGFPDFSPYAAKTVTFDPNFLGNHASDFVEANKMAGLDRTPEGYIWHHHQDGQTMQLVPKDVHGAVRHAGGVAIMKGRG